MSARKTNDFDDDDPPSLADRLLAAVLAPIVVNLVVFLGAATFFWHSRRMARWLNLAASVWLRFAILLAVIAAIGGFIGGSKGLASFVGHCFYTNSDSERNAAITAIIWLAIAVLAYCIATAA